MNARARAVALLALWCAALAVLGGFVTSHLNVGTDLRRFMPAPQTPEQHLLMEQLGEGPGSRLLLIALHGADTAALAATSRALAAKLRDDAHFVRVANGETDIAAIRSDKLPYRYLLSTTLDERALDAAFLRDELESRVEDLGSPAAGLLKPWLARDPTLEILKLAERWRPVHAPARIDGVWFAADRGAALLVAETSAAGFDPQGQRAALDALQSEFDAARNGALATLEVSGPGAFTVAMNDKISREANWIGVFDSIGFAVLLLIAYRNFATVLLGALPILSGGLIGMAALAAIFPEVHGITLAFGFTLIGVAQDYPIHLFSHRREGEPAIATARKLWPILSTGVASTCIAYAAFFASGVEGLQQLAVFTIGGLAGAALTTRFALPRVLPARVRDAAQSRFVGRAWDFVSRVPRPRVLPYALLLVALAVAALAPGAFWQNDLAALTPLPRDLVQRDDQLRREIGAPDVRYLLAVEGQSADEVLTREESLESALRGAIDQGTFVGYDFAARYLPSVATQRARQAKLPDADALRRALADAQRDLPFRADLFEPFVADVAAARELPPLDLASVGDLPIALPLKALLLPRGERVVGLVTLADVRDPRALMALASAAAGVRVLDLKAASESLVVAYRGRILLSLLIAAALLIAVCGYALKSWHRLSRVLAPMGLTTVLIVAVLRAFGVELSLFHLIALILAAGLGLDYALFFEHVEDERSEQLRTMHAVLVCTLSTFFVFALLALSSLPVLRAIGTTVTLGIVFNFALALLIARARPGERRAH